MTTLHSRLSTTHPRHAFFAEILPRLCLACAFAFVAAMIIGLV